jgi:hypothetical protein
MTSSRREAEYANDAAEGNFIFAHRFSVIARGETKTFACYGKGKKQKEYHAGVEKNK